MGWFKQFCDSCERAYDLGGFAPARPTKDDDDFFFTDINSKEAKAAGDFLTPAIKTLI